MREVSCIITESLTMCMCNSEDFFTSLSYAAGFCAVVAVLAGCAYCYSRPEDFFGASKDESSETESSDDETSETETSEDSEYDPDKDS